MGHRELRRVPKDWQHPRDSQGDYIPLFNGNYRTACDEYQRNVVLWAAGAHPDQASARECGCDYFWQWDGRPPPDPGERGSYMFTEPRDDLTHFQLYESTSEGTPLSPVFATADEVCEWAADNASAFGISHFVSADEWRAILIGGGPCLTENIGGRTVVFL
jgi:hypothetical protein